MNLLVTNYNNTYKVKGNLVKMNIRVFQNELKDVFKNRDAITLNLQELNNIDNHGVTAIAQLHNEAITKNKKLAIIGFGNNQLMNHFKSNKVA